MRWAGYILHWLNDSPRVRQSWSRGQTLVSLGEKSEPSWSKFPFSPLSPPQPISIRQTYFLFRGDLTRRGSRQKRRQVSPYRNLWKGTKKAMEKLYFKGPFYIISLQVIFNTNTNTDVILLVWSMSSSQRRRC